MFGVSLDTALLFVVSAVAVEGFRLSLRFGFDFWKACSSKVPWFTVE